MRVRRTGSSRLRGLIRPESDDGEKSSRNRHPHARIEPVSSVVVGGGCCPHPGGEARVYLTRPCANRSSRADGKRPLGEAEDRPGDHKALDLTRALVDLRDLRVAVVALDRKL